MTAVPGNAPVLCEVEWAGLTAQIEAWRDGAGRITALGEVRFPGGRSGKTAAMGALAEAVASVDRYLAAPLNPPGKGGARGETRPLVTLADLAVVLKANGPSAFLEIVKVLARLEAGALTGAGERRSVDQSQKERSDA